MSDSVYTMDLNIPDMTRFIIMNKLGTSLIDVYDKMGSTMRKNDVLKIGIELFSLIEKLHALKITHQDLKPDNILFGEQITNEQIKSTSNTVKCEKLELIQRKG